MIPDIGTKFTNNVKTVEVTRVTAESGHEGKQHRWIYYKNIKTQEKHCQRLDLFLRNYLIID